jgi:hypothetical protein
MKKIFTIVILALSFSAFAQVPTDSLELYYPFNGNANDESINSNDGTVIGATLTSDRFGNMNSAYSFDGSDDKIDLSSTLNLTSYDALTYSFWANSSWTSNYSFLMDFEQSPTERIALVARCTGGYFEVGFDNNISLSCKGYFDFTSIQNQWSHFVVTIDYLNDDLQIYINGQTILDTALNVAVVPVDFIAPGDFKIGCRYDDSYYTQVMLDDIRIYSKLVDSVDVSALYNEGLCYETITVTDTLIINANITGFNPVTYQNSIKIYPNPTNDQITIDFGSNYNTMNGYELKIMNTLSQVVYSTPINQNQTTVDLSTWTGYGIYFVHLINDSGHTIDIRKIVLQ